MILREQHISVRLPQEKTIDTGIVFVQNDKDVYKLNIRVFDGVYEIDYTEVEEATITFSKADGTVVQGNMQIEANQLTYVLGTNEIAAPGKLLASIQLLGANERLTTARFVFKVERDLITEDAVKSTSEFAILQRLKEELEAIDVVDLTNQFNAHKAESVTKTVLITEPFDQTTKTTVNLGFKPKLITIEAVIRASGYSSTGHCDETGQGFARHTRVAAGDYDIQGSGIVRLYYNQSNQLIGNVTITQTGIEINWELQGVLTGASGNRRLLVSAITHGEG
ncbi:MAG TPA: BppU family phage baseplate upper protein [Cytophagaceae bacterium]